MVHHGLLSRVAAGPVRDSRLSLAVGRAARRDQGSPQPRAPPPPRPAGLSPLPDAPTAGLPAPPAARARAGMLWRTRPSHA
ncbi:hypothetical protein DWU95_40780, partial [Burkholderia contaminans]